MLRSIPPTLRGHTLDLPQLPPLVLAILSQFLAPLLAWFSLSVYRAVLSRCASHPLVRLAQLYDPAPVVAACAPYYHAPGTKGTIPTYTIEQLVRAEIVRAWADSSPILNWSGCWPPICSRAGSSVCRCLPPPPTTRPSTASTPS